MELENSEQFQQQVLHAKKPVLIHFLKGGCTRCALLETTMEQLANDYRGRVVFAKYCLMNAFWIVTNMELKSRYKIDAYPTAVLFVNGQEKKRWIMYYDIRSYRQALDEAVGIRPQNASNPPPAGLQQPVQQPVVERGGGDRQSPEGTLRGDCGCEH
jgi:thioredoxin-like negative regulator of GroEL